MSERRSRRAAPGASNSRPARRSHGDADGTSGADAGTDSGARSRREFLRLLALGSIAAVAGAAAAPPRARAATPAKRPAPPPPPPAVKKEIQNQKEYLARTLQVIRDHPLETGSPMAFEFRPLRVARGSRKGKKS